MCIRDRIVSAACAAGFLLDLILGDPVWLYQPVRLIWKEISALEALLRRGPGRSHPAAAGAVMWILVAGTFFLIPLGILYGARRVHPALYLSLIHI